MSGMKEELTINWVQLSKERDIEDTLDIYPIETEQYNNSKSIWGFFIWYTKFINSCDMEANRVFDKYVERVKTRSN